MSRRDNPLPVPTARFAVDVTERLKSLEQLLDAHPSCGVGVIGRSRNIADAGTALAGLGIDVSGHTSLQATALVEFVAVSDVWLLSEAAAEANVRGSATRSLHLRDGQMADLHFIEISDRDLTTVAVIVPGAGETISTTPPPNAIPASPRVGLAMCDAFGVITSVSPSTVDLLGYPRDTIVGMPVVSLLHPEELEMAISNWLAAKEQHCVSLRWRCRLVRADGSTLWTETTITNEIDDNGDGEVQVDLYDVSLEVAATDALVRERELITFLTETLPVGVAKFDTTGQIEHANRRLAELLAPLDPRQLIEHGVRGELDDLDLAAAFATLVHDGASSRLVVDHTGADGAVRHLEWTISAAVGAEGDVTGGVVCVADVTEAAQLRHALELRATTDALTGCLNRAGTLTALERAFAHLGTNEGIGLLFLDLNDFKGINDSLGHAVGDAVLEVVAGRLRSGVRPGDMIGRLGGDEFVVISPGLHSASAAHVFAGRIARRLQGTAAIDGVPVRISASIGVAWTTTGTAAELIAAADAAMYVAKQAHSADPVLSGEWAPTDSELTSLTVEVSEACVPLPHLDFELDTHAAQSA